MVIFFTLKLLNIEGLVINLNIMGHSIEYLQKLMDYDSLSQSLEKAENLTL